LDFEFIREEYYNLTIPHFKRTIYTLSFIIYHMKAILLASYIALTLGSVITTSIGGNVVLGNQNGLYSLAGVNCIPTNNGYNHVKVNSNPNDLGRVNRVPTEIDSSKNLVKLRVCDRVPTGIDSSKNLVNLRGVNCIPSGYDGSKNLVRVPTEIEASKNLVNL
jgi:hypothetical protein